MPPYVSNPGVDPLRSPSSAALGFLISLVVLSAGALAWSCMVKIDIAASGVGRIVPSKQVQVVQNLEGGIVSEILVKEGQTVKRGQVLTRIQDTEFNATYNEAMATFGGYQAEAARLTAETEGTPLVFPSALEKEHPDFVAKESKLYESRRSELEATLDGLREEMSRARNARRKAEDTLPILRRSLALAKEQQGILAPQVAKGLVSRVEALGVEQRILELEGKISDGLREIPAANTTESEARHRMASERAKFRSEALARLAELRIKLAGQKAMLTAHKDRVTRREVRSPVNGVVKVRHITTIGEVVRPGDRILEIVPSDDVLVVEARFAPQDIAFIHPGQKSFIRVTAYDASIYGAMPAEVEQISADATVTERDEVYYRVRVRATGGFPSGNDQPLPLLPGMVANVDVVTGKRTLFDYMAKPITKLRYTALHER